MSATWRGDLCSPRSRRAAKRSDQRRREQQRQAMAGRRRQRRTRPAPPASQHAMTCSRAGGRRKPDLAVVQTAGISCTAARRRPCWPAGRCSRRNARRAPGCSTQRPRRRDDRAGVRESREQREVQVGVLAPGALVALVEAAHRAPARRARTKALAVTNTAFSRPAVLRALSVRRAGIGTSTAAPGRDTAATASAASPSASQSRSGIVSSSVKATIAPRAARQPRLRAPAGPRVPCGRR